MKLTNRPKFKRYIFAEEAAANTIEDVPETQTSAQETQGYIGYQHGYTINNMKSITEGGKPPRGQQINQLFKDITAVTQYATMGGTYPLNTDVTQSVGYPKNAIVCIDDAGLFRSLQDDNKETDYNNTTYWQKIVDFNPPKYIQRILGEIFYAVRTDTPNGCLKCDGKTYNSNTYPKLISYLKANKIAKVDLKSYDNEISANGGCIRFGYDNNGSTFRVPKIPSGYFLSNPVDNMVAAKNTITPKQGDYIKDQIVNITGSINYNGGAQGKTEIWGEEGALYHGGESNGKYPNPSKENTVKPRNFGIDASRVVTTGDRVMPRTMFTYAFVVVDDVYTEKL